MGKRLPIDEVPFVNDLNQTIQPGDRVLVVTTCTGTVHVATGTYLGGRFSKKVQRNFNWKTDSYEEGKEVIVGSVSVAIDATHRVLRHKETNEKWDYNRKPNAPHPGNKPYMPRGRYNHQTWKEESPSEQELATYHAKLENYNRLKPAYDAECEAKNSQYHWVTEPYVRRTTLQRNRIFPINITVDQLTKIRF